MRSYFKLLSVVAGLLLAGIATTETSAADGKIDITFIGHAAFEVRSPGGTTLLIDPFITKNPVAPEEMKNLSKYKPEAILVTHSHGDHVGDTVAIAAATGAKVVGAWDHINSLDLADGQGVGGNPGGQVTIGDVVVHWVPAMHSSDPGGRPVGFVLEFADGRTLYHTGDTGIFGDMSLIQEIYDPNIILLQAGGGPFNQQPQHAALAIKKYFDPDIIVPMHYGTFDILADKAEVAAAFEDDSRVRMMQPGDSASF